MTNQSSLKKLLKKIIGSFVGPILQVLHMKIFGRRIFINKYTRKLPFFEKIFNHVQTKVLAKQTAHDRITDYKKWLKKNYPNEKQLSYQIKNQINFKNRPKISLIMPVYNTEPRFLREAIQSVLDQTYDNWQLCIADDASTLSEVRTIIKDFADKDQRIDYVFLQNNGHISVASNSALELAKGEYIGLIDHDDIIWPNALYEIAKLINQNPTARFIYSDEDKIEETSKKHFEPFFKPDWSFEFLRSVNYITHFAVLERKLVENVGGFRKGYEGAQDWDLFLRISRQLDHVYHVQTILYSWRNVVSSTYCTVRL